MENSSQNLNLELPPDSTIAFVGIYVKEFKTGLRYLYVNAYCNIVHSSQKMKTTQGSISRWMDKQNAGYIYNGILFSYKKEWSSCTYCYMDKT